MGLLIALLIVAVLFGLGGLLTAAKWLLIVAAVLLVVGLVTGYRSRL